MFIEELNHRLSAIESQITRLVEVQESIMKLIQTVFDEDFEWMRLTESGFEFWDNDEDEVYDSL